MTSTYMSICMSICMCVCSGAYLHRCMNMSRTHNTHIHAHTTHTPHNNEFSIQLFFHESLPKLRQNIWITWTNQHLGVTPVEGSIFRPLSQAHISKREFKNGHISRFCSVFQVIQVISSAKFFSAEEVDLSFKSETKEHPQISNPSFWKRDHENVFVQMF